MAVEWFAGKGGTTTCVYKVAKRKRILIDSSCGFDP